MSESSDRVFKVQMRARLDYFAVNPGVADSIRNDFMFSGMCPCGLRIAKALESKRYLKARKGTR
jgi:hypothetical protein